MAENAGALHPDANLEKLIHQRPFLVLDEIRGVLPGKEVMLCYTSCWEVGSLIQSPSTIEIDDVLGRGATPECAILAAYKTVIMAGATPAGARSDG